MTHVTIASVTIFLHRHRPTVRWTCTHSLPFLPFLLWLTTGQVTKEWAAIHRKHHAKCEQPKIRTARMCTASRRCSGKVPSCIVPNPRTRKTMARYGHGTPDDWLERNLYTRYSWQGVGLMMIIDLTLFGAAGLAVWALQMAWIPITAAGIINGIGHYWGYRNFEAPTPAPTSRPGASSSAVRSCTTTTTPTRPRPSCRSSPMSSTSAGSTSVPCRPSAWRRSRRRRPSSLLAISSRWLMKKRSRP